MPRTAVVLLNLGGPDSLDSVQPFLHNLFRDPAILRLPRAFRELLAWIVSRKRTKEAREIYAYLGGKSPLLENTKSQAKALNKVLGDSYRVFIAMRYWHPLTDETVKEVLHYQPDQIILLPLYPQFSTTTTASSLKCWFDTCKKAGLNVRTRIVGCYPIAQGFLQAMVDLLRERLKKIKNLSSLHILFTAHGLPKKIIKKGDPYQGQVEKTALGIMEALEPDCYSWSLGYQSRVGPLEWIGPSTISEIKRLGGEGKNLILVPLSFISEHSETLYELDYQYKNLAEKYGVKEFFRLPTVSVHKKFIQQMADLCYQESSKGNFICLDQNNPCICYELMR
jgi:ferrochelatase